jgi:hypothetical protein
LPSYSQLKREYSQCKQTKSSYQKQIEKRILREAESKNRSYKILKLNKSYSATNNIELREWEESFTELLNSSRLYKSESLNLNNMLQGYESNAEYINV